MLIQQLSALLPLLPASASDLLNAVDLSVAGEMQFFDALLVSTAARAGCEVLLTEDMQHKRRVGSLELLHPFVMTTSELDQLFSF